MKNELGELVGRSVNYEERGSDGNSALGVGEGRQALLLGKQLGWRTRTPLKAFLIFCLFFPS